MAKSSKVAALKAQREKVETADAIRLQVQLAKATCEHCGQKPKVYCTRGATRYVRCACGRTGKVAVDRGIVRFKEMITDEQWEQIQAEESADTIEDEAQEEPEDA